MRALSMPEAPINAVDGVEQSDGTWKEDIRFALVQLGGKATLHKIYQETEHIRKKEGRSIPPTFDAIVRERLEVHSSDSEKYKGGPDIFYMPEGRGAGVWALR